MQYGFTDAIAKVGLVKFLSDLFWIGMFYHLYNQVCYIEASVSCLYNPVNWKLMVFGIVDVDLFSVITC